MIPKGSNSDLFVILWSERKLSAIIRYSTLKPFLGIGKVKNESLFLNYLDLKQEDNRPDNRPVMSSP